MNAKLGYIQDWPKLAQQAGWSARELARLCGVSTETLRRYFVKKIAKSTHQWLAEQRQKQALELLRDGSSVKETAAYLGYKQQGNFTREFKRFWGHVPQQIHQISSVPCEND